MVKVIFHIDLNAFFANAEVLRNSALEGEPVVVSNSNKRSVITTASYEARKYGITSGMPLYKAEKLCKNLIVVDTDINYYKKISNIFFDYIKNFSPLIEIASIDECYVDMTEVIKKYTRPLDLAWDIQNGLLKKYNLKCSIGIGPTKFLAKMASDMKKPLGIVVLRKSDIKEKLLPLPIEKMYGIGKKTAPLLKKNNIILIGDLLKIENQNTLKQLLGKNYYNVLACVKGESSNKLEYSKTLKSVSHSFTFNEDIIEYSEIYEMFKKIAYELSNKCEKNKIEGKLITISIRYYNFKNIVRSITLDEYTNKFKKIFEVALFLFDKYNDNDIPIRHLGISLGSLRSQNIKFEQLDFFNNNNSNINTKQKILDSLNDELSEKKLFFASDLLKK